MVIALLGAVLAPIVFMASPAAAAPVLAPGFNIATWAQVTGIDALTNFVFVPTTNTMLAVSKCGELARGTMTGGWVDESR